MHAWKIMGDIILKDGFDIFGIERHVIWLNIRNVRDQSVKAEVIPTSKLVAVNNATRVLQEIQSKERLCGNSLNNNLR
jgi:hypothetical protein